LQTRKTPHRGLFRKKEGDSEGEEVGKTPGSKKRPWARSPSKGKGRPESGGGEMRVRHKIESTMQGRPAIGIKEKRLAEFARNLSGVKTFFGRGGRAAGIKSKKEPYFPMGQIIIIKNGSTKIPQKKSLPQRKENCRHPRGEE